MEGKAKIDDALPILLKVLTNSHLPIRGIAFYGIISTQSILIIKF